MQGNRGQIRPASSPPKSPLQNPQVNATRISGAKFAEKHGSAFGRIELIREYPGADGKKHFYRLDMGKLQIRNKVRAIKSNDELDAIFDEYGERKITD